ncbi:zinc ribbon domain-containing protein [uncultured Ruegeria sp.]|uniref:Zn-ribbon domain-containing OB-fold protein n=1 Tax=uncultured Ruegeria sp. TaxID=259304 RepID=UPI002603ABFF|nr:zinc ribbon domain-containing protein [uncultured Ruegeria sp.]
MKQDITLNYTLGEGWLAPWLDGLREGKALASTCKECGNAHFPPLRACPTCRAPCDGWCALNGGASVVYRTTGADGDFAMVRFDGACGAAIANAQALPPDATRAILAPCRDAPPKLALIPEPET